VKLTVCLKLKTTPADDAALLATLDRANAAANAVSAVAWETQTFGQYALQKICYHDIRGRFDLTAQVVIRLLAKVADAYKLDRERQRRFRPQGSIAYDDRILRYGEDRVSIWTVEGRRVLPFACDDRSRRLLAGRQGESDLVHRDGVFYLFATVNYEEPPEGPVEDVIGVDLGIVNIAVDSDGERHSGSHVNCLRHRHRRLRSRLKRLYTRNINHTISKRLVAEAQRTKRALALEDLQGIRTRVRARKPQRATLSSWSFAQLRSFLEYKAQMAGVPVIAVDPRNTSRTCPACGHCEKANRVSQERFHCKRCGLAGLADFFAALILRDRGRAVVGQPNADAVGSANHTAGERMPSALAAG
jgi:IS605 OrfB family transposase